MKAITKYWIRFENWVLLQYLKNYLNKCPECREFLCAWNGGTLYRIVCKASLKRHLRRDFNTSMRPFGGISEPTKRRAWIEKMIKELS